VTPDIVEAVIEEAARFASPSWHPSTGSATVKASPSSATKCRFRRSSSSPTPRSRRRLAVDRREPEIGGQGLPKTVAVACEEMWNSANMAFALCPELSQGALLAIERHGATAVRSAYSRSSRRASGPARCVSPSRRRARISPRSHACAAEGDQYRLTGRKIFITWGDHAMTDNIVHLVLARLPDAPQGTRGISLFAVPKYLLRDDGSRGARNDVHPVSVEHKLGIHGSPTA
jgi:alkylation response protein AidB-like acyl-CoA dehydrogenase